MPDFARVSLLQLPLQGRSCGSLSAAVQSSHRCFAGLCRLCLAFPGATSFGGLCNLCLGANGFGAKWERSSAWACIPACVTSLRCVPIQNASNSLPTRRRMSSYWEVRIAAIQIEAPRSFLLPAFLDACVSLLGLLSVHSGLSARLGFPQRMSVAKQVRGRASGTRRPGRGGGRRGLCRAVLLGPWRHGRSPGPRLAVVCAPHKAPEAPAAPSHALHCNGSDGGGGGSGGGVGGMPASLRPPHRGGGHTRPRREQRPAC